MFRIPHQHKFPLTKLPSHSSQPPEVWSLRLECGISPDPLTRPSAACWPSVPTEPLPQPLAEDFASILFRRQFYLHRTGRKPATPTKRVREQEHKSRLNPFSEYQGFPPSWRSVCFIPKTASQPGKALERPSSTRLGARFPYHGSGALTRSPSPLAWLRIYI